MTTTKTKLAPCSKPAIQPPSAPQNTGSSPSPAFTPDTTSIALILTKRNTIIRSQIPAKDESSLFKGMKCNGCGKPLILPDKKINYVYALTCGHYLDVGCVNHSAYPRFSNGVPFYWECPRADCEVFQLTEDLGGSSFRHCPWEGAIPIRCPPKSNRK